MTTSPSWILRVLCYALTGLGLLLIMSAPAAASPKLHHELTVRLDPSDHRLSAIDRVTMQGLDRDRLLFFLAGHLKVTRVTLDGESIDFRFWRGRLTVPISPGPSEQQLVIAYEGVFNDTVDVQPLNTDNPGFGVTGTIQPQGTLLLSGAGWYPRGMVADTTYTIEVNAPPGVLAVIAGRALGHTTVKGRSLSRWAVDKPLEGLSLTAGPLKLATKQFGSVTAATYFSEPLQPLSEDYLDAVGRYIKLYEGRFGPYPFDRFSVVENFFPTGYGFASFTLLGRRVLQLPFIIHSSLGHEVAHCWWGNGVLVDASYGNWSEGLTTYVADYLYKELKGEGKAYRRQWLRNYAGLVNPQTDFPVSEFTHRTDPATKTIGYDKAAMVFHMLRQMVGEEKFWQTLRDVYKQYLFKAISWRHWQTAFERAAGRSLEGFFDQWIYRSGAPNLAIGNVTVTQAKSGYVIQGEVTQSRPYYDLSIDATIQTTAGELRRNLAVSGARTSFSWQVNQAPDKLIFDPDVNLFRQLAPIELPPTVNAVRGSSAVTVVVAQNLGRDWLAIAHRLSAALGLKGATVGMEARFSEKHLASNHLIWVGLPGHRKWLPDPSAAFSMKNNQIILSGQIHSLDAVDFFGVFAHPRNKERVTAMFLPGSISQAAVLSTKIPHYGKYSYLVFKASRNRIKGTWEPEASPLTVHWKASDKRSLKRGAL